MAAVPQESNENANTIDENWLEDDDINDLKVETKDDVIANTKNSDNSSTGNDDIDPIVFQALNQNLFNDEDSKQLELLTPQGSKNNKSKINSKSSEQKDEIATTTTNKSKSSNKPKPKEIKFKGLSGKQLSRGERSYRAIQVPGPRMIHVRRLWKEICDPVVTQLKLQIRMNSKKNLIEIRTSQHTKMTGALQKGADFIRAAAVLGFEIKDAIALIRMDDIYLESFDIRDVKFFNKKSDHWMRAVGRIAGQYGKIKYSIENSTNTRIVIFGFKVHILGSYTSIRLARNAISRLVMGSAPGNVYANLRVVSNRMKNRF